MLHVPGIYLRVSPHGIFPPRSAVLGNMLFRVEEEYADRVIFRCAENRIAAFRSDHSDSSEDDDTVGFDDDGVCSDYRRFC